MSWCERSELVGAEGWEGRASFVLVLTKWRLDIVCSMVHWSMEDRFVDQQESIQKDKIKFLVRIAIKKAVRNNVLTGFSEAVLE